jgi:hypothetical protein
MTYPHNESDRRETTKMANISEGSYMAKAIAVSGIAAKTGSQGIQVAFRLTDEGPFKDREIDWVGWLTDGTRERTAESLAVAGISIDERGQAKVSASRIVQLVIEHEPWTNEETGKSGVSAKVRWVNDANRGRTQFTALDPNQQNAALLSLRGLVMSYEAKSKAAAVPAKPAGSFDFGANAPETAPPDPKKAMF